MTETALYDRRSTIATLAKIGHGDLALYERDCLVAAMVDPEMFAHLTAWNQIHGKVRDSKVAYPILALRGTPRVDHNAFAENAVAHLMLLGPRELVRAYHFNKKLSGEAKRIPGGRRRLLERALKQYLVVRENKPRWWDQAVVSHRAAMRELYAITHRQPNDRAQGILFGEKPSDIRVKAGPHKYPRGSVFEAIAGLKTLLPADAARAILEFEIPLPVAMGALGASSRDETVWLALLDGATGNQVLAYGNSLKKSGLLDKPALGAAYDAALTRAKSDKRVDALKARRAVEAMGEDDEMAARVLAVQDAQVAKLGDIKGDWLVAGDHSGSMHESIKVARRIAALIAERVKPGKVYLVFFNAGPRLFNVTDKTLSEIEEMTQHVMADGMTSIGCPLELLRSKGIVVNGIAIASDGGDNAEPLFGPAYRKYSAQVGIDPPVYFFKLPGADDALSHEGVPLETFDLGSDVDYYSLPNIVSTLKTSKYALEEEIMETPLLTLAQVFQNS